MAIHAPGRRARNNKRAMGPKRNAVASLSLTALVDMFTVLTIFLLQNYNSTGEVIHIPIGFALESLPKPQQIDSQFGHFSLQSETHDQVVSFSSELEFTQYRIAARDYLSFRRFCAQIDAVMNEQLQLKRTIHSEVVH